MKRKAAITAINALYKAIDTCCNTVAKVFAIDLSGWEKVIERVAQDMQEGKLHPDDLDTEMLHKTYNDLNDGLRAGYGKEFLKINKDTGAPDPSALKLQQNIYKFSGAKTFAQLQELNSKLVINGRRATWDEFKKEALKINANYNINHLQAEHETANQSAQHAVNWQQYERNKKQYPNLKYMTQQDDRVRPEHQALQGIVAPVGSDFWNKYYPPNGWRCRCYVVQTSEKATHDVPDDVPSVPKEFRMNVGKSGQVFNEEDTKDAKAHPYFALAKDVGGKALEQVFERSKLTAPYNQVYTAKSGGTVHVSPFADTTDFADNFKTATIIADDLGFEVRLRPHLDGHIIRNQSNPEYLINDKIADRKAPQGNRLSNLLRKSQQQGCEVVVFDLSDYPNDEKQFYRKLKNSFSSDSNYPAIQEVIVISGGKAQHYKRKDLK